MGERPENGDTTRILERAKRDPILTLIAIGALGTGGGGLLSSNNVNAQLSEIKVQMAEIKGAVSRAGETEKSVADIKATLAKQDAQIQSLQETVRRIERGAAPK